MFAQLATLFALPSTCISDVIAPGISLRRSGAEACHNIWQELIYLTETEKTMREDGDRRTVHCVRVCHCMSGTHHTDLHVLITNLP